MSKKGFTLIELLVAVSIIGILLAIGITNFRVANQKARDGRRKGDLEQIKAALELYRTDENDYPLTITFGEALSSATETYMAEIPEDPLSGNSYVYSSATGASYSIGTYLELEETDSSSLSGCSDESGDCNYEVDSPL
jgi:general secretion pathway protein G